jgi:hypothetical protein
VTSQSDQVAQHLYPLPGHCSTSNNGLNELS